jgi:hypothetical protein
MSGEPSVTNAGNFASRDRDGMNGVGILVIHDKDVMVTATGGDRKETGLVRVRLEDCLFGDEHSANLMGAGVQWRSKVEVGIGESERRKGSGGA